MQALPRFTVETPNLVWDHTWGDVRTGDTVYYTLPLPSGEEVAALVHTQAVQEAGPAALRMPVGTLRPFDSKQQADVQNTVKSPGGYRLSTTAYYIDMRGDFAKSKTLEQFDAWFSKKIAPLFFILLLCLIRWAGVRLGWFAPAFFALRDPLLPQNNLELWALATCALWAEKGWPMEMCIRDSPKTGNRHVH